MALTKRIIPCLDIQNGRTVKGTQFVNLRDLGDPVALAVQYAAAGADELVFLDIAAGDGQRKTLLTLITAIARQIDIPFTVGGGITSVNDIYTLLNAGADKISVNTAAIRNPRLISDAARRFGSQCIITAIDAGYTKGSWTVYQSGGKIATGIPATDWAKQAAALGAGEILLTAINNDGTGNGFALDLTHAVSAMVSIPVIASGGAGHKEHFAAVLHDNIADAALAAGLFHTNKLSIGELKQYLYTQNIPVRR